MGYTLPSGVSCCRAGAYVFFLDRTRDRYFAIGDAVRTSFDRLLNSLADDDDEACLDALTKDGLLIRTSGAERPKPCKHDHRAEDSAIDLAEHLTGSPPMLPAAARIVAAKFVLRRFGLARSLNRLEARKQRARALVSDAQLLARVAGSFERCNAIFSPLDMCLPRSIAVAHRLLDLGQSPTFIMGVRAQPFGAHAWVECGDLIVNDRFDTVEPYTPILAL